MKKLSCLKTLAAAGFAVLLSGCSSTYYLKHSDQKTVLSDKERANLTAGKFSVPCRLEVSCPDDMTGKRDTFAGGVVHYPLKQILSGCFGNALYSSFDQPSGEVIDSFTLFVDAHASLLAMSGSKAIYDLKLHITLAEPGEKKVVTLDMNKFVSGPVTSDDDVPDAVYDAVRGLAIDTMSSLKSNPKVLKTVKRFEQK